MIEEAGTRPAQFFCDSQVEETLGTQAIVVLDRVRGIAVVFGGAGGEVGRQVQAALLEMALVLR